MGDVEKTVTLRVQAKDQASATLKKVADNAKKELSTIDRLKGSLSGSSELGDIADTLQGAGLTGALHAIGESLGAATGKILEMNKAAKEGKVNWSDYTLEIMKALPLIGGFAEAGANFNELITNEKGSLESIAAQGKAVTDYMASQQRSMSAIKADADSFDSRLKSIRNQIELIGLKGLPAAQISLRQGYENTESGIRKESEKARQAAQAERKKQIAAADEYAKITGTQTRSLLDALKFTSPVTAGLSLAMPKPPDENNSATAGALRRQAMQDELKAIEQVNEREATLIKEAKAENALRLTEAAREDQKMRLDAAMANEAKITQLQFDAAQERLKQHRNFVRAEIEQENRERSLALGMINDADQPGLRAATIEAYDEKIKTKAFQRARDALAPFAKFMNFGGSGDPFAKLDPLGGAKSQQGQNERFLTGIGSTESPLLKQVKRGADAAERTARALEAASTGSRSIPLFSN